MQEQQYKLKSIWFFLGLVIILMGLVVFGSGLYALLTHQIGHTALANLHPNIWWGMIMIIFGTIFVFTNK